MSSEEFQSLNRMILRQTEINDLIDTQIQGIDKQIEIIWGGHEELGRVVMQVNKSVGEITALIRELELFRRLEAVESTQVKLLDIVDTIIKKQAESNEVVADALATIRRIEESRDK